MGQNISIEKFLSMGPWPKGIDNIHDPLRLKEGSLQTATNVDIDDVGRLSRRDGVINLHQMVAHSLWSDGDLLAFFVSDGRLYQLNTDYSTSLIRTGLNDSRMSYVRVISKTYCTNGHEIFYVEDGAAHDIPIPTDINKYPLPAGQLIEYYMNRLYVASGRTIWISDAVHHTRIDKRKGFKQLRSDIKMMRAVSGGIYLSDSDKTYFMAGEVPEKATLITVLDYPAIFGTDVLIDGEKFQSGQIVAKMAMWASRNGICVGLTGGQVMNVSCDRYEMPEGVEGAGLCRDNEDNVSQYITVLRS